MTIKYSKEELSQTGIYAIVHRESGKVYIGSAGNSFRQRWQQHKHQLRKGRHHSILLQRAWNKYSEFAFDFKILEIVPKDEWLDNQYLTDVEQTWLDSTQAYDPEKGYNICPTAGSNLGVKLSEEARRNISESRKGEKHHQWGKPLSEEHRQNISQSKTNSKTYSFISPEGELVEITNLNGFCKEKGLTQSAMFNMAKGKFKQHKGWRLAA